MRKNSQETVRSHLQERQWLINLGGGNIVEGVKNLIERINTEQVRDSNYSKGTIKRSK